MKSMSASVLSRSISLLMLSVSASWYTWGVVLYCNCVNNRSPCSIMSLLNIETLAVFRWTWLNFLCFNRFALFYLRTEFFVQRIHTDLLTNGDVFLSSFISSGRPDLSRIGFGVSWVDWKKLGLSNNFPFWLSSNFPFWLMHNFWTQLPLSIRDVRRALVGDRGDMYAFSYKTSPVFSLTTFGIQWAGNILWRMIAFDRVW